MPRVSAAAVTAEAPSPTSMPPGMIHINVEDVASPTPVGTAPPINPTIKRSRAVALERHLVKRAELLDHAHIDRGERSRYWRPAAGTSPPTAA